jgi:hypothetical protein
LTYSITIAGRLLPDQRSRSSEHVHFHSLDVDLDEVHPRELEGTERDAGDFAGARRVVVDRLTGEFGLRAALDLDAAEARRPGVVELGAFVIPDWSEAAAKIARALKALLMAMLPARA